MLIRSQIIALLNDILNQTARLRKGGCQAVYFCPICKHYKRKLEVCLDESEDFGKWHCWTCNIKGSYLGSLLSKVKAASSYRERLMKLTGDLRLAARHRKKASPTEVVLPEEFHPLSKPKATPEYKNALMYLKKRGIIREDILRYNIGYCEEGDYAYHIIIPSYDANGNLNFFVGRRYYKDDPGIPHKKPQMPMDFVGFESFLNYEEPIILVESAFNAITIRRNAIPLFGKYPSKKLLEKLLQNGVKKVYICLDSDAKKDAFSVCEKMLSLGIIPYFVKIEGGKDPNEVGFGKSWECIKNAEEVDFSVLLHHRLFG